MNQADKRMSWEELMAKPVSLNVEQYQGIVWKMHELERKIRSLSNDMYDAMDSMSVFEPDDTSDPRYKQYKAEFHRVRDKRDKLDNEYTKLKEYLDGYK